jgi:NADPH:quinone reductase
LIDFYHNLSCLIGVDTLKFGGAKIAAILEALRPGFESGALEPYEVTTWQLDDAVAAYTAVEKGAGEKKQVLIPA